MVINYNNFINTENESNKIILFNNDKMGFLNKKIYFKFETNLNYDGISLIKNLKYGKEHKIENKIFMIDMNYFETEEDEKLYLKIQKKLNLY